MTLNHTLLAILVTFLWGINFLFVKLGLHSSPPLFLGFMRFAAVALLVLFIPRPPIKWTTLTLLGFFMYVGQFSMVFTSMKLGFPPGLISVVVQSQLIFTIALISLTQRQWPSRGTLIGILIALVGLYCIGQSMAGDKDVTLVEFFLALLASFSWAIGNLMMGRLGRVDMLATTSWMALYSLPFFAALTLAFEGPNLIWHAVLGFDWTTLVSVLFIAYISTSISYSGWGWLISRYGASVVAPYSLLVPVSGVVSAVLVVGESFDFLRASGIFFIILGLAVLSYLRYREAKSVKA
ncbi:MAG: EamA family transporter [Candidatus Symbiobacter sp.]|nr:EamA family transporter [Candidatus Symbiobacter sp.]